MSVAVNDLNTRRQKRLINITGASNCRSKSRTGLSSADLLHAVDESTKMAKSTESQYNNTLHDMVALFGKHDIVNFLYLYGASSDSWICQIRLWVLLKCVKIILLGSIDDGVSQ